MIALPNVKLLSHTPDPERLVSLAAKLCYSPCSIGETSEKITPEKAKSFIEMLMNLGHESPLEHITFTFGIEGVSRAFLAQLTRHRIASYSVQSQRYVKEDNFKYIIPPEIAEDDEAKQEFLSAMQKAQESYLAITSILCKKHKQSFMRYGMDAIQAEKQAQKKAIEDARFVLPNACETKIICTFNARSLINFFSQRCCNRAQWEIRSVAKEMFRLVFEVAPTVFQFAGPSCITGFCKEGKMSCRQSKQVREEFLHIKGRNS